MAAVLRLPTLVRLVLAVALLGAVAVASASGSSTQRLSGPAGIVPVLGAAPHDAGRTSQSLLAYHGGPVMRTSTTYAIFWLPSGSGLSFGGDNAGYEAAIGRFLADVAHDSGGMSNVFGIDTQYYDTLSGRQTHIAYNSTFGGSAVATDPLPARRCTDGAGDTDCVTDAQLQAEIESVVAARHWPEDSSHLYFILTPEGLGSCAGSECSYTTYCAYHDDFFPSGGAGPILYADQPWTYGQGTGCDDGQYPNASAADPTINVLSHEFNEAITDAEPSTTLAWIDSGGSEIGDKCAWSFGSTSGPSGAEYNQTIDGRHYLLQEEFDNATDACRLRPTAPAAGPVVSSLAPASGAVGAAVTIGGSGFTGAKSVKFDGKTALFTVVADTQIATTVPLGARSGPIAVTTKLGTALSSEPFLVLPTVTSFSPVAAKVGRKVTIHGSGFAGATAVSFNGTSATRITVSSDRTIGAYVPTGATTGAISVTTPSGTATSSTPFTVEQ